MDDTKVRPRLLPLVLFILSFLPFSSSQANAPVNIETFFPVQTFPVNNPWATTPSSNSQTSSSSSSTSNSTIAKAVGITAASTLLLAGIFFFLFQKYTDAHNPPQLEKTTSSRSLIRQEQVVVPPNEFKRLDGALKGLILDDNGLDVLYWRKLGAESENNSFSNKDVLHDRNGEGEEEEERSNGGDRRRKSGPIQEVPLLSGRFINSSSRICPQEEDSYGVNVTPSSSHGIALEAVAKSEKPSSSNPLPPPSAAPPPPPPSMPSKKNPPPPPPIPAKKGGPPAPPAPPHARLPTPLKPPPAPNRNDSRKESKSTSGEKGSGQTKLKPLHWDKVTTKVDHSMVWHKINDGSFRFDGDLMEALFGYVATDRKTPGRNRDSSNMGNSNIDSPARIFILDHRKSQNTGIVLRSLAVSRQEILDALLEGCGLSADTLEKLMRIAPTKEEETQILEFNGDPTQLADSESFLFHILKAVPSAFARLNALLFRSNYDHEILQVKESLQTLESACNELRTRGLFVKLLEAILKAGNRMNAGTARGNAQAFNLTALRKLSDVKSTDGRTTLLHFVVEEVVRSEGKRCLINRNHSLGRSNSRISNSSVEGSVGFQSGEAKKEREKEYTRLGLPVVGGLSVEFSNVKKAARIDHDGFAKVCPALKARVDEIRQFLGRFSMRDGGGFVRNMKGFLEAAEDELKVVEEEQTRVMEQVKKTTEYYQSKASKFKDAPPLQLFEIVKDFLDMVDQACIDIARNQQKEEASAGSSSPVSPANRVPVSFPNLPAHFLSDKSSPRASSSSSDSDAGGSRLQREALD